MTNDIASELAKLHELTGSDFSRQIELIALRRDFHPIDNYPNIYTTGGEKSDDYDNLLKAAKKAVEYGYRVFVLPNPKGIRTADFILERKGVYKMYDLKTVTGGSSVNNRLVDSIGQSNRVLLNMATNYNVRQLGKDIRHYFEFNPYAIEVMIFKGHRQIVVKRQYAMSTDFVKVFMMRYNNRKAAKKRLS